MLFVAPDAAAFAGARGLAHPPGTHWAYSSGTSNIICRVLRESFDVDADYHDYPYLQLFDRLGMRTAVIETDPSGTFVGSSLMYASARDWLRFGLFYLRDGVTAEGDRLLPEGWVAESTTPTEGARARSVRPRVVAQCRCC